MSVQRAAIRRAVAVLHAGGIVAYPTEGVWGLGCDPDNPAALERLIRLKGRDPAKGLILIADALEALADYIEIPSRMALRRARESWPGPVTWVFPAGPAVLPLLSGGRETVAVRVSAHPVVRALCAAYGKPLVSTSANRSGRPPARSRTEVRLRFPGVTLVPGALGGMDRPTPIREASTGHYLRR